VIVVWQLKASMRGASGRALRLIGGAFFALAVYILVQAGYVLLTRVACRSAVCLPPAGA